MADSNVSLVPTIEPSKVQTVIGELEILKAALVPLEQDAKALKVETAGDYESAGNLLKKVRDNRKQGAWTIAPLKTIATTITTYFRTAELQHQNKCELVESIIEPKMNDYKRREREAAAIEERRINEERQKEANRQAEEARRTLQAQAEADRKAREREIALAQKNDKIGKREAAKLQKQAYEEHLRQEAEADMVAASIQKSVQAVEVQPNTPTISGLRQRLNWKFRIVDASKVKRAFLIPDEKTIAQFVRNMKDAKKTEELIGGIEVYTEDSL